MAGILLCGAAWAETQPEADGRAAAEWQYRHEKNKEQLEPDAVRQSARESADAIASLRGKWRGASLRAFEREYDTRLKELRENRYISRRWGFLDEFKPAQEGILPLVAVIATILAVGFIIWKLAKDPGVFPEVPVEVSEPPPPNIKFDEPLSDNYGSASFSLQMVESAASITNGVFFGKSSTPEVEGDPSHWRYHRGAPVCSTKESHTLIVAPTRTGKGTRVLVPTLLSCLSPSMLAIDPKGENAAITARVRSLQNVHILNPWGELADTFRGLGFAPATYNPLDILDRNDPNIVAVAQSIAAAICPSDGKGKDAFWNNSAASLLTSVFLWLTDHPGEAKTLARAREIVTRPKPDLDKYVAKMASNRNELYGDAIRENVGFLIGLAPDTYSGVISNLAQHTRFLSDPQIKKATATSSFSMSDLAMKRTTVYLVIPPDRMEVQRTWLRLMITAGMQTFKRIGGARKFRAMFLIDEFPALGHIQELPRDLATMSGYGVDFTLAVQGLDQLKDVYGDAHATILNNCAYKWFCNVSDLQTAEWLSKALGKKTVRTTSTSQSKAAPGAGTTATETESRGETGRDLLTPDEVLNLGRDVAILLAPGTRPHYLRPIDYWKLVKAFPDLPDAGKYWSRYDPNPYHRARQGA
jgi:type IV secretory pathway TraG/TraD family ATPase VirD4